VDRPILVFAGSRSYAIEVSRLVHDYPSVGERPVGLACKRMQHGDCLRSGVYHKQAWQKQKCKYRNSDSAANDHPNKITSCYFYHGGTSLRATGEGLKLDGIVSQVDAGFKLEKFAFWLQRKFEQLWQAKAD